MLKRMGGQFTIGDCGAPRQLARCPECGASIGGGYGGLAAGVTRANEFARLDESLGRLALH